MCSPKEQQLQNGKIAFDEGRYQEAYHIFQSLQQIPEAMYYLGLICYHGYDGVVSLRDKAMHMLNLAANNGFGKAQLFLGRIWKEDGMLVVAKKYFENAFSNNELEAALELGLLWSDQQQFDLARKYFEQAAYSEEVPPIPLAQLNLALMCEKGSGGERDLDKAKFLFKEALKNGLKNDSQVEIAVNALRRLVPSLTIIGREYLIEGQFYIVLSCDEETIKVKLSSETAFYDKPNPIGPQQWLVHDNKDDYDTIYGL